MNRMASTANPVLVGLLLVAAGVPCAFAQEAPAKHDMSPEARILPGPPAPDSFIPDHHYPDTYSAKDQLGIYANVADGGTRHTNPNPTGVPAVEAGIRMYDRGAYTPRPTWLAATSKC